MSTKSGKKRERAKKIGATPFFDFLFYPSSFVGT